MVIPANKKAQPAFNGLRFFMQANTPRIGSYFFVGRGYTSYPNATHIAAGAFAVFNAPTKNILSQIIITAKVDAFASTF